MSVPVEPAIRYARHLLLVAVVAIAAPALLAGCGSTVEDGTRLTVYASLPLEGERGTAGRQVLAGMEQALEEAGGEAAGAPVAIEALEAGGPAPVDGSGYRQAETAANARAAAQDSTSIAYVGELDPGASLFSIPITNEAGLLQLTPAQVDRELLAEPGGNDVPDNVQASGERTFGTLGLPPAAELQPEAGYDAMTLILESIEQAQDPLSRADVVAAYLAREDVNPIGEIASP